MILTLCFPLLTKYYVDAPKAIFALAHNQIKCSTHNNEFVGHIHNVLLNIVPIEIVNPCCCTIIKALSEKLGYNTTIICSIADDENGDTIHKNLTHDKIYLCLGTLESKKSGVNHVILNDKEWITLEEPRDTINVSKHYKEEITNSVQNAEIIYLCASCIYNAPEIAELIVSMITTQHLIFNLTNYRKLPLLSVKLLENIFKKSNVIFGTYYEIDTLKDLLFPGDYRSAISFMKSDVNADKIFVLTNENNKTIYTYNNIYRILAGNKIDYAELNKSGASAQFTAGFISAYCKGGYTVKECLQIGLEWAVEYRIKGVN